jgi:AcrR family transcriptional regulator
VDCSEHLAKRADARRNRAQILVAAEICFAEQGVGVPIDDIARRACVGVGTVYRHFPTKEALAEAVVVTRMEKLVDEARSVAESDDPGGAFFGFLQTLSEAGSAKRDLIDALSGAGIDVKEKLYSLKDELTAAIGELLERAKQVGAVREDVDLADLFGLVMGTCASAQGEIGCSQARMLSIVCDGLRSPAVATAGAQTARS